MLGKVRLFHGNTDALAPKNETLPVRNQHNYDVADKTQLLFIFLITIHMIGISIININVLQIAL